MTVVRALPMGFYLSCSPRRLAKGSSAAGGTGGGGEN